MGQQNKKPHEQEQEHKNPSHIQKPGQPQKQDGNRHDQKSQPLTNPTKKPTSN